MFQASRDYNVLTFNPKWNATFNFSLPCAKPVLKTYLDRHPSIIDSMTSSSSLSLSDSEYEGLCKALLLFWSNGMIDIEVYDGERFNEEIFMGKVTLLISSFHPLIKKITELEMKGNYSLEKIKPIQRVSGTISLIAYLHIPEKKYLEDQITTMLKQNDIAARLLIEQQRLNSKGSASSSSGGVRGSTPNRRASAVPAPSGAINNKGKGAAGGVSNSRSSYPLNNYDDSGIDSFNNDQNDLMDDSYGGNESSSSELYNQKQQNQSKRNPNSNKRSTYGGPIPLPSSSLRGSSASPNPPSSSFQQNFGSFNKKISGFMKSFASKAVPSQDEADILLSGESGDEEGHSDEDATEYQRYQTSDYRHDHPPSQPQQKQQLRYASPSSSRPVTAGGSGTVPSSSSANPVRKPLSFNPTSADRPSTAPAPMTSSPNSPPISSLDEIRHHSNIHVSSLVDRESLLESKITKRNFLSDMSKQLNGLEKMQESTEKVVNNLSKQLQAKKVSQIIDTSLIHNPSPVAVNSFSTPPVPTSSISSLSSKPSKSPASVDSSLPVNNQHNTRPSLRLPPHQPPPPPPPPLASFPSSSSSVHLTPPSAAGTSSSSAASKRRASLSLGLKELQSQVNQAVTSLEQFLEIPLLDPEEDKHGKRNSNVSASKGPLRSKSRESLESELQLSKSSSSLSPSKKKNDHHPSSSFHSYHQDDNDREMFEADDNNHYVKEKDYYNRAATSGRRVDHHVDVDDDDDEFLIDEDDDFNDEEERNQDEFDEDIDRNGDQLTRKKSEYDNNKYLGEKRVSVRDLYNQHVYKYHNPDSPHSSSLQPAPFSSDVPPSSSALKKKPIPPPPPPRPASLVNKDGYNMNRLNQRIDSDDDSDNRDEIERIARSASKTSNRSSSNDNHGQHHHTHYPSSSPASSAYYTPSKEEPSSHRVPHNTPATATLGNRVFEGNRSLSQSDIDELSERVKQLSRLSFSSTDDHGAAPSVVPSVPSISVSRTKSTDSFNSFASSPSKTNPQMKPSSPQKSDKISKSKSKSLSVDVEDDFDIEKKGNNVPVQRLSKKGPVAASGKPSTESTGGRLIISSSSSIPSGPALSPLADSPGKSGAKRSPRLESSIPKLTPNSKEKVTPRGFLSPASVSSSSVSNQSVSSTSSRAGTTTNKPGKTSTASSKYSSSSRSRASSGPLKKATLVLEEEL
jgi:hypothetical protein